MTKKELFEQYEVIKDSVLAITLYISMPTGETEVIENTNVASKMEYLDETYNDDLVHKYCKQIQILDAHFLLDTEEMDFGSALHYLKEGRKIARKQWAKKDEFLYYVPKAEYPPCTDAAKEMFSGGNVPYKAYIAIKNSEDDVVPWTASQSDILANDWVVVK